MCRIKTRVFLVLAVLSSSQILYANEGESKKEQEVEPLPIGEKSSYICHKGHEFIPTLYHFPTNCEACTKPLWNMFKPPPALECRRCHIKCHKDHMDKKEEVIAPCRGGKLPERVLPSEHEYTLFNPVKGNVFRSAVYRRFDTRRIINMPEPIKIHM